MLEDFAEYEGRVDEEAQPDMRGRLTTAAAIERFMLAGNATITVRSLRTGTRFTYKIRKPDPTPDFPNPVHFVNLLTGQDNTSDYQYLGLIRDNVFRRTSKSRITDKAPGYVAFEWFWRQVIQNQLPATVEVWHEGRCGRCGRKLTVPESIESGFGPECLEMIGGML